jgi:catechol 2,3-dioxygenase-like lactoylglutathione lyase family enzyme
MKRFHVHIAVNDLQESIRFYSKLFGVEPSVTRRDYAKWMLDDPRINFAISTRGQSPGVNHLGFQVDSAEELTSMQAQLQAADAHLVKQTGTACCYARSDKYWITDPTGIAWESFHTLGAVPFFGAEPSNNESRACCIPLKVDATSPKDTACCVPTVDSQITSTKCCS